MHFNVYDVFYSLCSHYHVLAAIVVIFRVTLSQYMGKMWLALSLSLDNN